MNIYITGPIAVFNMYCQTSVKCRVGLIHSGYSLVPRSRSVLLGNEAILHRCQVTMQLPVYQPDPLNDSLVPQIQ